MIDVKTREAVIRKNHGWQFFDDGLGSRRVTLDGNEVKHVSRANERRGIIDVMGDPIRLDKYRKNIRTRRLHGIVRVESL